MQDGQHRRYAEQQGRNTARWENHANFIVNHQAGSSTDVLKLMYEMRQKVQNKYNIDLEPELRFLGGNNHKENELCKILYKK